MSQGNPTQHEIDTYCAQWILNGGSQAKAWRVAYPNSTMNDDGARVKACNMHKMVNVQLTLSDMQAELAEKDAVEFDVSAADLKKILFDTIAEGREKDPATGKPYGLGVVHGCVGEINRMSGYHAATKIEAKVTDVTPDQRKSRIAELMGKLTNGA